MKTFYLLTCVRCNNEYADARPRYAVLEVDVELVERLLAQIDRVKRLKLEAKEEEDKRLYTMEFWDGSMTWIGDIDFDAQEQPITDLLTGMTDLDEDQCTGNLSDYVYEGNFALLDRMPKYDQADSDNSVECETRLVTEESIGWEAIIRHGSDYVTTDHVHVEGWNQILAFLKKQEARK